MQNGYFAEFWDTNIVKGSTINYITAPSAWNLSLPILTILLTVSFFVILTLIRRDFSERGLKRAGLLSFLFAWGFFALRMDLNWMAMLKKDVGIYAGSDMSGRIAATSGNDLVYFIDFVKKSLPDGASVREIQIDQYDPAYTLTRLGNYYMLPVMTSSKGEFVWVYYFTDASYDPDTEMLRVYGSFFRARPFATYKDGAYVFKILDE